MSSSKDNKEKRDRPGSGKPSGDTPGPKMPRPTLEEENQPLRLTTQLDPSSSAATGDAASDSTLIPTALVFPPPHPQAPPQGDPHPSVPSTSASQSEKAKEEEDLYCTPLIYTEAMMTEARKPQSEINLPEEFREYNSLFEDPSFEYSAYNTMNSDPDIDPQLKGFSRPYKSAKRHLARLYLSLVAACMLLREVVPFSLKELQVYIGSVWGIKTGKATLDDDDIGELESEKLPVTKKVMDTLLRLMMLPFKLAINPVVLRGETIPEDVFATTTRIWSRAMQDEIGGGFAVHAVSTLFRHVRAAPVFSLAVDLFDHNCRELSRRKSCYADIPVILILQGKAAVQRFIDQMCNGGAFADGFAFTIAVLGAITKAFMSKTLLSATQVKDELLAGGIPDTVMVDDHIEYICQAIVDEHAAKGIDAWMKSTVINNEFKFRTPTTPDEIDALQDIWCPIAVPNLKGIHLTMDDVKDSLVNHQVIAYYPDDCTWYPAVVLAMSPDMKTGLLYYPGSGSVESIDFQECVSKQHILVL